MMMQQRTRQQAYLACLHVFFAVCHECVNLPNIVLHELDHERHGQICQTILPCNLHAHMTASEWQVRAFCWTPNLPKCSEISLDAVPFGALGTTILRCLHALITGPLNAARKATKHQATPQKRSSCNCCFLLDRKPTSIATSGLIRS